MSDPAPDVAPVAVVVAAGSGTRLGAALPKALVEVRGVSLLVRSLRRLEAAGVSEVVVVHPEGEEDRFRRVLADAGCSARLVVGGEERQHSVANGLGSLPEGPADQAVLIHDAARAFVPVEVVARVVEAIRGGASAVIPVTPVTDTIRELTDEGSHVIDRSRLRSVQTPQGFLRGVILDAHVALADMATVVTDDAAAAEFIDHTVTLVPGAREAFKVTDPLDLLLAEALAAREG